MSLLSVTIVGGGECTLGVAPCTCSHVHPFLCVCPPSASPPLARQHSNMLLCTSTSPAALPRLQQAFPLQ